MPERPFWTLFFLATITVIFSLQSFFPFGDFLFVPATAFERPWTFITPIFLHGGFQHLFFNMLALFFFGLSLESRIGRKQFLLVFFVAGIFGSLGYMITAANPYTPALGASGAIYGVMGALAVVAPFSIVYVGYAPMPMILAAFLWGTTEILGLFGPPTGIARGAHLGGLFFGIIYGFYLRRKLAREMMRRRVRKV